MVLINNYSHIFGTMIPLYENNLQKISFQKLSVFIQEQSFR